MTDFFESLDRITAAEYVPTAMDVLMRRLPTTGVRSNTFTMINDSVRITDTGGQRSERRKWIDAFGNVTALLFVASLSCYDLHLYEDSEVNAMTESLNLFNINHTGVCRNQRQ